MIYIYIYKSRFWYHNLRQLGHVHTLQLIRSDSAYFISGCCMKWPLDGVISKRKCDLWAEVCVLLLSSDDDDYDNVVRRQCCHISSIWCIISIKYFKQKWVVQTLISQVRSSTHDTEERRKPASKVSTSHLIMF